MSSSDSSDFSSSSGPYVHSKLLDEPMPLVSSSSDDDTDVNTIAVIAEAAHFMFQNTASSSVPRHRTFLHRDRQTAEQQLMADYFVPNSKFGDVIFRNRFRMSRRLFVRIAQDLEMNYPIFQTTYNAGGVKVFTGLQKCTSAIRQLGGGKDIMYACLILHNMIIQDEGRAICPVHVPDSPNEQEVSPDMILEIRNQ